MWGGDITTTTQQLGGGGGGGGGVGGIFLNYVGRRFGQGIGLISTAFISFVLVHLTNMVTV